MIQIKLRLQQKFPILDRTICVKIVSYELPFSIYEEKDPDIIDDTEIDSAKEKITERALAR